MEENFLGRQIAKLRFQKGLSQESLAEKAEVSLQALAAWEDGTASPNANELARLCTALSVSADKLLGTPAAPAKTQPANTQQLYTHLTERPISAADTFKKWLVVFAVFTGIDFLLTLILPLESDSLFYSLFSLAYSVVALGSYIMFLVSKQPSENRGLWILFIVLLAASFFASILFSILALTGLNLQGLIVWLFILLGLDIAYEILAPFAFKRTEESDRVRVLYFVLIALRFMLSFCSVFVSAVFAYKFLTAAASALNTVLLFVLSLCVDFKTETVSYKSKHPPRY